MTSGTQISDMTVTPSLPAGTFAPIVVTDVTTGLLPTLNYRYDLGTDLLTRVSYSVLAASGGSGLVGFLQSGTGADAETVEDATRRIAVFPEQYAGNDTVALQAAVDAAAGRILILTGTYSITDEIVLPSNIQIIAGSAGATVTTATADISHFFADGRTGIEIRGIRFVRTVAGTAPYVGGVSLQGCTDCIVDSCEFEGMQWAGVYLSSTGTGMSLVPCVRNTVSNNYFHDFLGSVQDAADICIYRSSSYNQIYGNSCYGGNWHGILLQDPYESHRPTNNHVYDNVVGAHGCYGIAVYIPGEGAVISPPDLGTAANTYNNIHHNTVEDITGAQPLDSGSPLVLDAGAGIYVVGKGAGGTKVDGNILARCCLSTNSRTLAPGQIGILGIDVDCAPISVNGNTLSEITRYDGILISGCKGVTTVAGNAVRMPSANNTGDPVRLENSDNISLGAQSIERDGGTRCLLVYANDEAVTGISITGLTLVGRAEFAKNASGTFARVSIAALTCTGVANAIIPLTLSTIAGLSVSGCSLNASTNYGISVVACTYAAFSGNSVTGGVGTTTVGGLLSSGTCTGSSFDKSNVLTGLVGNGATGLLVEQYASAAPVAGTGAVGDSRAQSVPVAGQPKGWMCTVAAEPGTWVSTGNL